MNEKYLPSDIWIYAVGHFVGYSIETIITAEVDILDKMTWSDL